MSFQTGLSGLNAASRNLEVIGHNIANANTTGMKAGRAEFSEIYASSLGATGGTNVGIGVQVATVAQMFTQGNLKITGNQLDLAINGTGFFHVKGTDGTPMFTRNGEFKLDKEGFVVTNNGAKLQKFSTDAAGQITSRVHSDLQFPTQGIPPRVTGIPNVNLASLGVQIGGNLSATAPILPPPTAPLTPAQRSISTTTVAFDALGSPVPIQLYFVKTAANTWDVVASSDDGNTLLTGGGTLSFDVDGRLVTTPPPTLADITIPAATPPSTVPSTTLNIPITLANPGGTPNISQIGPNTGIFAGAPPAQSASRGIEVSANLDARAPILSAPIASPLTADQKRFGTALNVFDSQGSPMPIQIYFIKTAANTWQVAASRDNGNNLLPGGGTLGFDGNGVLTTSAQTHITIPAATAPATVPITALSIPLSFTDADNNPTVTQFGANFGIVDLKQDGYSTGNLTSIDIGEDGLIMARFSNGISRAEGQLTLANFRNLQGLQPLNGGFWAETFRSGQPIPGTPQNAGLGLVRQNALEESNVELTQELVNMMVAQRSYQANAQTIRTQDQILQTLVNMR